MNNQRTMRLGDVAYLITEKKAIHNFTCGNYISTSNMLGEVLGIKPIAGLPKKGKATIFKRGDTLFSNIRVYFRKIWLAEFDGGSSADVLVFRAINNKIDPLYLNSIISSNNFTEYAISVSNGAKMPRADKQALLEYPIILPSIETQKREMEIIRSINEKISNMTKIKVELQNFAIQLFKSWFIDFNFVFSKEYSNQNNCINEENPVLFPDSFNNPPPEHFPMGWHVKQIGDFVNLIRGISYKGKHLEVNPSLGVPMINLGCFNINGEFNPRKIKYYSGDYKNRHKLSSGDLLIANTDITQERLVLGSAIIVPKYLDQCLFTHHTTLIKLKESVPESMSHYLFYLTKSNKFSSHVSGFATGTTVLNMPPDTITKYRIPIPPLSLLEEFYHISSDIQSFIESNDDLKGTIIQCRDTLILKSLSKELA